MELFLIILLIIIAAIILSIVGWIGMGVAMLIGTAWFQPNRLFTGGAFRFDVAAALVLIWPVPAFIGLLRMVTWPARRLAKKRATPQESEEEAGEAGVVPRFHLTKEAAVTLFRERSVMS